MISPVSLHYMTVIMGHNIRGVNTPTLRHRHPLHMLDIVPSKCVQTCKKLPYWNSVVSLYVMTFILLAQNHIRGLLQLPLVQHGLSSAPFHRMTQLQPFSSPIMLGYLFYTMLPLFFLFMHSAFFVSLLCSCGKAMGSDKPTKV
jgi:hypothetical protein